MSTSTIRVLASSECGSAFEAGQAIAMQVFTQSQGQVSPEQTVQLMRGVFSGAMAVLQVTVGEQQVAELFAELQAAVPAEARERGH